MNEPNKDATESLESIIWNNWGIVEVLADRREKLKVEVIEALFNAMNDEETAPETTPSSSIFGKVQKRTAGRGVETKYFKELASEGQVADGTDLDQISLGAITIDFPKAQDGILSLELSASLPQKTLFGNGLDDSKKFIAQKVKASGAHLIGNATPAESQSEEEVVNIADLDAATGRNDIAKRIVPADSFKDPKGEGDISYNIDEFVDSVMVIYKLYTQIPRWLADIPRRDT